MSAPQDDALAAAVAEHGPFPMPVGEPMPVELPEHQLEALIDAGNRALNDHYHEGQCHCDAWPASCVSSDSYFMGAWDTDAFAIGVPAVLGVWESLRNDRHAAKVAELRAERAQLQNDITGACLARYEEEQDAKRARFAAKLARKRAFDLRAERDAFADWADTLAYKVAPVEVLGRHGEEGKYPWGDALELLTPAAEVDALEARHAAVLALHRKHTDSDHCFADDETWPCQTLIALGRTDDEPPSPKDDAAELRADNDRLRARVAELEGDLDAGVNAAVRDALVGSAVRAARAEDPHDGPLSHRYELGRDLPELGGSR